MQTENPYWLKEAYSSTITNQDIGLVQRNLNLAELTKKVIIKNFDVTGKFLDWAGGYGLFTRLMRDKGFDFYHHDPFCQNLFAKGFEKEGGNFEFVTAFEVLEHLENPLESLTDMFTRSSSIIFSEELIPERDIENWWYLAPEHGQHIAFYSKRSLEFIANHFGAKLISNGNLHAITRDRRNIYIPPTQKTFMMELATKIYNRFNYHILRKPRLTSLTGRDFRESRLI